MSMLLLTISIMLSFLFFFSTHPLTMGFILLMQSITISLISGLSNLNFWFSYILFLIMVGGMLVLFIYMTSIASNEKFNYSNYLMVMFFSLLMLMMITMIFMEKFSHYNNISNMDIFTLNFSEMWKLPLSKYFNYPSNFMLLMLMIYLFVTLIAIVKITNPQEGPLRQKF
uniref:NADH-ubiquinone oxidoreductase chain 6 n=1 Tax=Coomaniella copipes TaxID=2936727 RepID=A0A8T9VT54_9COLE|nr:NADH dehydrogenase subunit 6 [Coomaniella copipes]UPI13481.1 NADH dehydrogenase subunit 6 [Coomaniella copipes]